MKVKTTSKRKIVIYLVFFIFIIVFIFLSYSFSLAQVVGISMYPTVDHDQWIVTNHLVYQIDQPNRGDIVIIDHEGDTYIKRIIGLPNETIEIKNQQLYIDGIPYNQVFITGAGSFWTNDIKKTNIPDASYYVLGDNRRTSRDSRDGIHSLGFINQADITGRVEFIIYPVSDWQIIY